MSGIRNYSGSPAGQAAAMFTTLEEAERMYVCMCHGISDRQIREVLDRGAKSLSEVQTQLPVADCCGCCTQAAQDVIDLHKNTARRAILA